MKTAVSIIALIALALSLSFSVAHAQRAGSGPYYGSQRGGWNCPWMGAGGAGGQRGRGAGRGGYYCPTGGNGRAQGWGMGPARHGRGAVARSSSTAPTDN